MKLLSAILLLSILFASDVSASTKDKYVSHLDIPLVFFDRNLKPPVSRKNYLAFLIKGIENATPRGLPVTKEEIEAKDEELLRVRGNAQLARLIQYDSNLNQRLDIKEIEEIIKDRHSHQSFNYIKTAIKKELEHFLSKHDHDQDGEISYQEMATPTKSGHKDALKNSTSHVFREYFWLDPTKDNVLTIEDIESMANKTFNTLDTNEDDVISEKEYDVLNNKFPRYGGQVHVSLRRNDHVNSNCRFEDTTFPENMRVYAVKPVYKKLHETDRILKRYKQVFQANVTVSDPGHPVALILGHPPGSVVWNIKKTPGTKILAVVYHKEGTYDEEIVGLSPKTKLFANYIPGRGRPLCGPLSFDLKDFSLLNAYSRQLFGKPVDMLFSYTEVGEYPVDAKTLKDYKKQNLIPKFDKDLFEVKQRNAVLKDDIGTMYLRLSTIEDYEDWATNVIDKRTEGTYLKDTTDLPPVGNFKTDRYLIKTNDVDEIYTIMKPYRCPAPETLNNKNIVFIVDKRTSLPHGSHCSHYRIYDLNRYQCYAPESDRESDDICGDWNPKADLQDRGVNYLRKHMAR